MTWALNGTTAGGSDWPSPQLSECYADEIVIGLVNNMPDGAFRTTENQIRSLLLTAAPAGIKFRLQLFALPQISRDRSIRKDIEERYDDAEQIDRHKVDAVIVTGAEPKEAELQNEVYWEGLTTLIDWARANTLSAVWSCLACHAVVQHLDAIPRQKYPQKLSGVYRSERSAEHAILAHLGTSWSVPHSRMNSLSEASLAANGYEVVSRLSAGGPDMFVKDVGSLFVCLQGHPEYDRDTLLREYRRDVHRYLDGTTSSYPEIPVAYFDPRDQRLLCKLKDLMMSYRPSRCPPFPDLFGFTDYSWRSSAVRLYRGWLEWLVLQCASAGWQAQSHFTSLQTSPMRADAAVAPRLAVR